MRVPLIWAHIAAGIVAFAIALVYLTQLAVHWKSMGRLRGRKLNVTISLALAFLWSFSGIIIWWDRVFLPWTQTALWIHAATTVVGVPYLLGHAIFRWLRIELPLPWAKSRPNSAEASPGVRRRKLSKAILRRRAMAALGGTVAGVAALSIIPVFMRGMERSREALALRRSAPAEAEGLIPPTPDPRSQPPIGKGARGTFRIYNVASTFPQFDPDTWRFQVKGLVSRPVNISWQEVASLPRDVWVRDFHCVTGWSVSSVTWEGIPLGALLDQAGVRPEATHVKFYSFDGVYTDALTLDQAYLNDVFLAIFKDGQLLTLEEGGPIRLVVPRMFAYKSVKWLDTIELIDTPHIGYWQRLGYQVDAWLPGVPTDGDLPHH